MKAKVENVKWCAFMMDMEVEEMPIHHSEKGLTREQIDMIKGYRRKDCLTTCGLLYVTIGQVHKVAELNGGIVPDALYDYSGKNKIQDRFDVQKQTGLDCLNMSDVKIGEEWNKLDYKLEAGIKDESTLFNRKVKHPYGTKFKNYFPKTVDFKTDLLQNFAKSVGEEYILSKKQEFKVTIGQTTYTVAKGGLHSTESHRRIQSVNGMICRDADVGSQYPWFIAKNEVYAPHLRRTIIDQFKGKIFKRIELKSKGTKLKKAGDDVAARPFMSIQEMLKLCLNGGYYGKLNQPGSFLEYPEGMLKVTIGCQFEILMLIEMFEEAGITVLSGNTDGVVAYFPKDKEAAYNQVCKDWEKKVGNDQVIEGTQLGALEFVDYETLWQESINHYIGKPMDITDKDGKVIKQKIKKKGRFMTEFELHKNKSKRIIALALEAYFIHGKSPIEFIQNHKNIYDFTIAKKAYGQLHYEELIGEEAKVHKKLIRYYVSNDGNIFKKRGINNNGDPMDNHVEATDKDFPWMGQPLLQYFNKPFETENYNINYSYYILETLKRIDKIEKTKKANLYADRFKTQQGSLF